MSSWESDLQQSAIFQIWKKVLILECKVIPLSKGFVPIKTLMHWENLTPSAFTHKSSGGNSGKTKYGKDSQALGIYKGRKSWKEEEDPEDRMHPIPGLQWARAESARHLCPKEGEAGREGVSSPG